MNSEIKAGCQHDLHWLFTAMGLLRLQRYSSISLIFNANGEYIKTKERLFYSRVNSKYKPIDSKSTCEND